jgi:hypothetical protein
MKFVTPANAALPETATGVVPSEHGVSALSDFQIREAAMTRRSDVVVKAPNGHTPEHWASLITNAWREHLPSIFETGNLLESAKQELLHGQWMKMVKEMLPFKVGQAERLMKISDNDNLRNSAVQPNLPVAWTILYELTKLTEEQFDKGIKSGAIHPAMATKEARALRGLEPRKKKDSAGTTIAQLRESLTPLLLALPKDERRLEITRIMGAADMSGHDWVSTITLGRR